MTKYIHKQQYVCPFISADRWKHASSIDRAMTSRGEVEGGAQATADIIHQSKAYEVYACERMGAFMSVACMSKRKELRGWLYERVLCIGSKQAISEIRWVSSSLD